MSCGCASRNNDGSLDNMKDRAMFIVRCHGISLHLES